MSHSQGARTPKAEALRRTLTHFLRETAARLTDHQEEIAELDRRLSEPLTLAVAGHTNAGKSTLVNALIGSHIAPTAKTECTRVTTWYRFGPEQPELIAKDGSRRPVWLVEDPRSGQRHLPDSLPIPAADVDRLEVSMMFEPLRHVTVIDTPGLSGDVGLAGQTEALLASGAADVLLFVLNGERELASEEAVITDFRRRTRSRYGFPGNAFGVLSRADTYPGPDSMGAARAVADRLAVQFRRQLAGVLPVMGHIAATIETGTFAQRHTDALHKIAALPDDQRRTMLLSAPLLLKSETLGQTVLPRSDRQALIDRLTIFGIRALTEPTYASSSTDALYAAMYDMSGMQTVRSRLAALFIDPRMVHKATQVLAAVTRIAKSADVDEDTRDAVLDGAQTILGSDAMHVLAELRALAAVYSGAVTMGDELVAIEAALRLFEREDPADRLGCTATDLDTLTETASRAIGYWQALSNSTLDAMSREVAATAVRTASILLHELKGRP